MIIGLTGTYGSGKDTVAEYLEKTMNFEHFSLSDELRREIVKRGIPPLRENLIKLGTQLRASEGDSTLAKRVLKNIKPEKNYVVTSIRHPAEIEELKKHGDFFMANVDASVEIRFRKNTEQAQKGRPRNPSKAAGNGKAGVADKRPGPAAGRVH